MGNTVPEGALPGKTFLRDASPNLPPDAARKAKTGRAIMGAFAVAILLKIFLFDFMITEGRSMMPSIKPGSVLFVWKIAYGFRLPWTEGYLVQWADPKEGDVIVFYTPQGVTAVKRCAGITGNHRFIALGDNREVSFDSISYGPVPVTHIIGKVLRMKGSAAEGVYTVR